MALRRFKLENLSLKMQIAFVALLGIGLSLVGYMFWLKDLVAARSSLRTEIAQLETVVAQATEVENRLAQFQRELADLNTHLDELRRILPDQKETPDVLRTVQRMASESNLKIIKFAPQPTAPRAFYSDWPITMEVQGCYDALGSFFEKVGLFRRVVNVDNISIKAIDGSTDPGRTLTSTCTATTFVYREDHGAATGK